MEIIRCFDGEYDWLSNFYLCDICYEGEYYTSTEAAFQAQKCIDIKEKKLFLDLAPGKAKRLGKKVKLRSDWEDVKERIMLKVLWIKFTSHDDLREKLLQTDNAYLIEGNYWGDQFWGVCPVDGEPGRDGLNKLGQLLMLVRSNIKKTL